MARGKLQFDIIGDATKMAGSFVALGAVITVMSSAVRSLADVHKFNKRGIGVYSDELASWFKNFNRYNKGSEVIPGAFKIPGSKFWRFDLDVWDQHLEEARENQFKEG